MILNRYIEEAPRDTFKDILDAVDSFVYFENKNTDSAEAELRWQQSVLQVYFKANLIR